MWVLKEDGTHDKFSYKKVKKNKENNEKDAPNDDKEAENEGEDDEEDSDGMEEVLTFICNEKVQ